MMLLRAETIVQQERCTPVDRPKEVFDTPQRPRAFARLGILPIPPPHQVSSEKLSQSGPGPLVRACSVCRKWPTRGAGWDSAGGSGRGMRATTTTAMASAITQSSWQPDSASALPRGWMMNHCSSWMVVRSCTQMENRRVASPSAEMSCCRETSSVFQPILSDRTCGSWSGITAR